jgi:hypothetical protein
MTIKRRKGQFFSGFFMLVIIVITWYMYILEALYGCFIKVLIFTFLQNVGTSMSWPLYCTVAVHVMWTISAKFRFVEPRAKMTAKLNA